MTHDHSEISSNNKYSIKKVTTIEEHISRYLLVTQKYAQKGYLDGIEKIPVSQPIESLLSIGNNGTKNESLFKDALNTEGKLISDGVNDIFLDKYRSNSICFLAKDYIDVYGSARLIMRDSQGLPTINDPAIQIFDDYRYVYNEDIAEFSQFVVKDGKCTHISIGLLKIAFQYSTTKLNIHKWVATIDNSVLRFLNSRFFNFNLTAIGPRVYYLGSECTPVLIDLNRALDNSRRLESSRKIAEYILGINTMGYEDIEIAY